MTGMRRNRSSARTIAESVLLGQLHETGGGHNRLDDVFIIRPNSRDRIVIAVHDDFAVTIDRGS
ncbi:hypothetical protein X551_04305 [Methylibium sp. T29]|nr:hypothetical protein X551_04305 [Methylibium sp. T29]EWS58106.1 hypothetical protein Y694_03990 [Methylibium sp. T29-B]